MTGPSGGTGAPQSGARPQSDAATALAGRAAPDSQSTAGMGEASTPANATPGSQTLNLGRGTAFEQAQANAQGRARAAHAEAVRQQERARGVGLEQAATAQLAAAPAVVVPPRRELRPRAPRTGLTIGPVHTGQIVTWQSAILAGLAATGLDTPWMILLIALSIAAVALTAIRYRDRWLYQWVALRMRYVARGKTVDGRRSGGDAATVARGGVINSFEIDDQQYGLISHDTGYTAVIEAIRAPSSGQLTSEVTLPPLDQLIPAYDPDEPAVSVQIVIGTVPAPGLRTDDAVGQSYRQLTEGRVPAQRRTWFALQALHTPDVHTPHDMTAALVNVLRRVERKLEKAGLTVHILREAELREEFLSLTNLSQAPESLSAARERWDHWQAGDLIHVTFRIKNWPDLSNSDGAALIQNLAQVPAFSVTVSVAICRDGPTNEIEAAVRVVVPNKETLAQAIDQMQRIAESSGAQLQRLDGEHRFGVGASVPLGGFAA